MHTTRIVASNKLTVATVAENVITFTAPILMIVIVFIFMLAGLGIIQL